jgi:hypothetical protein
VLSRRNKQILALSTLGMFLFAGLGWIIQSLATESIAAFIEMSEASNQAGHRFNGGIWYSLLAALLFSIAFAPLASAFTIMTYRNKDVSDAWIGQTYGLLAGIPMAVIWALLWLICLPFTWGLLPWGEWSINWWKIFPFGFGLIWMGGLPLLIIGINFFKKLANPEYKAEEIAGIMPSIEEEKELIEIIESILGQPIRFRINDPPKRGDAWVGIYPVSTGDYDHGDRWRWLRDIDVNNATLPGQSAGKWSIRVFKDGGYNLVGRLDFDIIEVDEKSIQSAKKIQSALKQATKEKKTNFWDSVQ